MAYRASGNRPSHAGRIVGYEALIEFELVPGDVALVLFLEQHVPFSDRAAHTAADVLAALDNADLAPRPPECIGAGVDRIGQYVVDGIISGQFPDDAERLGSPRLGGQHDAFLSQPDMNLAGAAKLGELREHQPQGFPHSAVRVLLDPVAPGLHVARRNTEKKRATPRFLFQRLLRALAEQRQLQFAHRSLHPEQQPIIGMPRIVDSVLVDDNRSNQSTELDQRMPVTAVARQT